MGHILRDLKTYFLPCWGRWREEWPLNTTYTVSTSLNSLSILRPLLTVTEVVS